jgi:ElaA protein
MINWRLARFEDLTAREIHDLFQARASVFVVEQNCAFQDLDGVDPECWHLLGHLPSPRPSPKGEGELVAYCRLVPPGVKYAEPSIGRVVTTQAARRTGLGRTLMREALARAGELWPGRAIRIGAQQRLERFYEDFGFVTSSAPYDEDGIPHIEMLRAPQGAAEKRKPVRQLEK